MRRLPLARLGSAKAAVLKALLAAGLAGVAIFGWRLLGKSQANSVLDRLRAGADVEVDAASAPVALLEA
ncbi:hypothetical protein MXD81_26020, partial [Microbacteriaceae bacterium K1510]|nr:hypothetical protein [Microbacteriaceae bacterium K1510]